ncbi:MAG: DNA recombination protein RmuC [Flavobacteriia bacterium]|nr:DNA recombination protein RmuC [Flavobacteriia bacterium]OIP45118.1 MAG: DNA polymerase V [Flavobacteriaceae bacterium CG2_30_31_66]PIV95314.1 MAG: DNA recombination protein RmuC [Flavobacteriaceae bacterium CG17_big_fil_post_rev_8_21_14_2_50_31_13]PIY13645.1 MAG: DNA recombination protein RmuC [Flavobacteriaceae bacterium CG_4_10_14_3_um_filter_31_253]PIZ11794.1 MAG: DNA recombination protein RmuC [Flavobacteriaceae bacterium CG_4_10_14_0_8_um_filter_31_99]PJC09011.1 MAG: DNA recombination
MNAIIIYFFLALIFGVIGFFIGKILGKLNFETSKTTLEKEKSSLETQVFSLEKALQNKENEKLFLENEKKEIQQEKETLLSENSQQKTNLENLQTKLLEQKNEVEKLQEKFTKEFENLANKILDEKSTKFTLQNKENMETILNPLQEKIKGFEDKVEKTHKESIDYHAALRQQIVGLKELNQQMSKETLNLTKALKGDSKVQGDWGETQLEILLEKANLVKDIHFTTQGGYRDEEGKLKKPDFIINLPNNRHLIVDSKVSLTAYERYFSAENEEEKAVYLKNHVESMRKHFRDLSEKRYEKLYDINSPDYVLMFVPIEPAYLLALSNNDGLYLEALDKNIVLVSTSTLLATLSTISSMWRQENQKRNVIEIAKQAGALYDQFVNLTEDLIKVGNQLKTVQGTYDVSMKKLTGRGNLVSKVESIRKLGATTSKILPQNLLDRAQENF